jgi:hypothetical protein
MQISLSQLTNAIRLVQSRRLWKPQSAERHLRTRKVRGHLSSDATLADYEQIIALILEDGSAQVYIYQERSIPYVAISAFHNNALWLVIFAQDGALETAFIVENPKSEFTFVDALGNLL